MCQPRHRHNEWFKLLRLIDRKTPQALTLHLAVDNYATHSHPEVQARLARQLVLGVSLLRVQALRCFHDRRPLAPVSLRATAAQYPSKAMAQQDKVQGLGPVVFDA